MWVTVYTDAAYNSGQGFAAIAYYIRCDRGLIKEGQELAFDSVRDNNEAEMIAIEKALQRSFIEWKGIYGIQVNTDSMVSRDVLKYRARKSKKYSSIQNQVNSLMENNSCYLKIKHVTAHQNDDGIRTWLNNWCDAEAKKQKMLNR